MAGHCLAAGRKVTVLWQVAALPMAGHWPACLRDEYQRVSTIVEITARFCNNRAVLNKQPMIKQFVIINK